MEFQYIKESHLLDGHKKRVNQLCFNNDGSLLASGSNDKNIIIWDTNSFNKIKIIDHKFVIYSLCYLNNDILICGDTYG